jgi:hypothetical protein
MNRKSDVLATHKTAIKLDITPSPRMYSTFRNAGYSNYSAICDIIDNSVDAGAKKISVNILPSEENEAEIGSILISDNGTGINQEHFIEVFRIAGEGGKEFSSDLGAYGVGLKLAAISIGRKLEIITKTIDSEIIHVTHDIDDIAVNGFSIDVEPANKEQIKLFKSLCKDGHGTIIVLSKLDRLNSTKIKTLQDGLVKEISQTYKIFIEEFNVKFLVNGIEVSAFDFMHRDFKETELLSKFNEEFEFEGSRVRFNAYYIPKRDYKINKDIQRNGRNSGLYIFRNNRLVGRGLDLGIIGKQSDGYLHGFRCEVFIDGDSDKIFGSTFMKVITEKEKGEVNQSFRDTFSLIIKKYTQTARFLEGKNRRDDDGDLVDDSTIIKSINKNTLIERVKGVGKERGKYDKTKEPVSTQIKPKQFCDVKKEKLGERAEIFQVSYIQGKNIVHINTDHVFYKEAYSKLDEQARGYFLRFFVGMALSKQSMGYYDDNEKDKLVNEFFSETSEQVRKLLIG